MHDASLRPARLTTRPREAVSPFPGPVYMTGEPPHPRVTETATASSSSGDVPIEDPEFRTTAAAEPTPAPLPEDTTVLHIGDSFAGALGISLNREFKQAHVRGVLHFKTSTSIPAWAFSRQVPVYVAQLHPDLVLISLGANEIANKDPEQRIPMIRKLVGMLDGRPCVWISPPLWKKADPSGGLLDVIRANCSPCRYLDTDALVPNIPRVPDGIHPTMAARDEWAKIVVKWLAEERAPTPDQPWALKPE